MPLEAVLVQVAGRHVGCRNQRYATFEERREEAGQDHRVGNVGDEELVEAEDACVLSDVFGYNFKGQVEYAIDPTASLGLAGSLNNGNGYTEGIVQLYLRKTFDWFAPVAIRNDPEAIAARDLPGSHL